jgi:hypothetical protein
MQLSPDTAVVNIQGKTRVMTQAQSAIYLDRW